MSWQFEKKGVIHIEKKLIDEDRLTEIALELSVEDIKSETEGYVIYTSPNDFDQVYDALQEQSLEIANGEVTMVPKNTIEVTVEQNTQIQNLIELLDDHEDVKSVSSNEEVTS